MSYSLQQINALSVDEFVAVFGAIYEHSPWVAAQAATARPFTSLEHLRQTMQSNVVGASPHAQLELICAHPELQGRAPTTLTADSKSEQKAVGLDQCSPQEIEQLATLNRAYREKFGFPFVIAVRELTRNDIIDSLTRRLINDRDAELQTCLEQIYKIAGLRIAAITR